MIQKLSSGVAVLGLLVTIGCGVASKSPTEVVEAAYMAANEGRYSEASEYLSSAIHSNLEAGSAADLLKVLWDQQTSGGTIERIEVLEETIRGEGAEVRFRVHYSDGTTKEDDEPLIQEDGRWKITVG